MGTLFKACASYIFRAEPKKGSATEEVPNLAWVETPDLTIYEMPFAYFIGWIMKKFWNKFKAFWKRVWDYVVYLWKHPRTTLPAFLIAEIIFWIPFWVPALLALIVNPWWWTVVGAVTAFWAGPFTPAIALQVGFIAALERLFVKLKKKKETKENGK